MLVFHGTRPFGKHDRFVYDGDIAFVATDMVHGNWLPVWPKDSFVHLASGERLRIRTTMKSLALAYLSAWPVLVAVMMLLVVPGYWNSLAAYRTVTTDDRLVGVVLTVLAIVTWLWILTWKHIPGLGWATTDRASELRELVEASLSSDAD